MEERETENKGGYWLSNVSEEHEKVVHELKVCSQNMAGSPAEIEIWKIEQSEINVRYDRKTSNLLKLGSWVSAEDLGKGNTLHDISTRGFTFSNGGMQFTVGNVDFKVGSDKTILVFCEIAVGRSFVIDQDPSDRVLPTGYDTFYISPIVLDKNNDGEFSLQEYQAVAHFNERHATDYQHQYFLRDSDLACPKYIVRFTWTPASGQSPFRAPTSGPPTDTDDYFDIVEHRPVKSQERAINPNVVTIDQAFEHVLLEQGRGDPLIDGKLAWLDRQLDSVDTKLRSINLNYSEVHEGIREVTDKAIARLQALTREKLETILCVEIELRRQKEHLAFLDAYLEKSLVETKAIISSPGATAAAKKKAKIDFMKVWRAHEHYKFSIGRMKSSDSHTRVLAAVKSNLAMVGELQVFEQREAGADAASALLGSSEAPAPTSRSSSPRGQGQGQGGQAALSSTGDSGSHSPRSTAHALSSHLHGGPAELVAGQASDTRYAQAVRDFVGEHAQLIQGLLSSGAGAGAEGGAMDSTALPLPPSVCAPSVVGEFYPLRLARSATDGDMHAMAMGSSRSQPLKHTDPRRVFESILKDAVIPPSKAAKGVRGGQQEEYTTTLLDTKETHKSFQSKTLSGSQQLGGDKGQRNAQAPPFAVPSARGPSPGVGASRLVYTQTSQMRVQSEVEGGGFEYSGGDASRVSMPLLALLKLAAQAGQPSLRTQTERKIKQLQTRNVTSFESELHALVKSDILQNDEPQLVYFVLPFLSRPPAVTLIYSTFKHGRSLSDLYLKTNQNRSSVILLIRSGEFKFGAYLSEPLLISDSWAGGPACFLFSLTLDMKIPYHARDPPEGGRWGPVSFLAGRRELVIGNDDLVLDSTLTSGTSQLEGCFGIGLDRQSSEASTMLAGHSHFEIDDVEVWMVERVERGQHL